MKKTNNFLLLQVVEKNYSSPSAIRSFGKIMGKLIPKENTDSQKVNISKQIEFQTNEILYATFSQ